ncbi:MAG: DUF4339 domain-containing protein, partial [Muribaculaceae bacterium]|nr:DUF4339 domain-containing protein [Muribaculaceae bacterium]
MKNNKRYFARINRTTQGPFTLTELVQLEIRPSTYVWCKGMSDWQKAGDVPDICRAMRFALAGLPVPGEDEPRLTAGKPESNPGNDTDESGWLRFRNFPEPPAKEVDYDVKPKGVSIFMALILTIFFFPPTGLATLWYASRFKYLWLSSEDSSISSETVDYTHLTLPT